jgi:hypothetical protein
MTEHRRNLTAEVFLASETLARAGAESTPRWVQPPLLHTWAGPFLARHVLLESALWRATFPSYHRSARGGRTHYPRCAQPATPIVRGTPDSEDVQDLEPTGIDYELGGLMAFEESSE